MVSRVLSTLMILLSSSICQAQSFAKGSELLVEYDSRSSGIVSYHPTALLQVYGDGKLLVNQPWHRLDQGVYRGQLDQHELLSLLGQLEKLAIYADKSTDVQAQVKHEIIWQQEQQGVAISRSETMTSRFSFNLAGQTKLQRSTWLDLQWLAGQTKAIDGLNRAARTERLLRALLEHDSLKRVGEAEFRGVRQ